MRLLKLCIIQGLLSSDEVALYKKYSDDVPDLSVSWSIIFGVLAVVIAVLFLPLPLYTRIFYALSIFVLCAFVLVMLRRQKIRQYQRALQPTSLDDCNHKLHLHELFSKKTCNPSVSSSARVIDPTKPAEIKVGDVRLLCLVECR